VEGAALSSPRETELQVDLVDTDERCDAVSYTVADPALEVAIVRSDAAALQDEVKVHVTPIGARVPVATETIPGGATEIKKTISVPAGHYTVTLTPKHADEAKMRVNRLIPDAATAAVALLANAPVKLELAPAYTEVQFIAYWQTTGVYKGTDNPCALDPSIPNLDARAKDFQARWKTESMGDIEGRCKVMAKAIDRAHQSTNVKKSLTTDRHVLKVFMAPEFYFRGRQGVYPFEAVSEILNVKALRDELEKDQYRDWLFVLGTAIGAIEGGGGREKIGHEGDVTDVLNGIRLKVSCPKSSPAAGVTNSWRVAIDTSGGSWSTQWEEGLWDAAKIHEDASTAYLEIGVNTVPAFLAAQKLRLSPDGITWHDVALIDARKTVFLKVTPKPKTPAPVVNWTIDIGGVTAAPITAVKPDGPGKFQIEASVPTDFAPATGKLKINDPGGLRTEHAGATIRSVLRDRVVHIQCPTSSPQAAVAAGWKLRIDTTGSGTFASHDELDIAEVRNLGTSGANTKFDLMVRNNPVFTAEQKLAVYDGSAIYQVVGRREPTKIIRFIVATGGPRPAPGWAIEGAVKGAILKVVHLRTDQFLLDVGTKLDAAPTAGSAVTLVEPGETEIINIAPVFKGGKNSEAPLGADGRALKHLLVYKETVSSVDFTTLDYGSSDFFYRDVRHLITAYGDQSRRALPTAGSTDTLGRSPNVSGDVSSSGYRVSEVSISGIGGGTVFTLDRITFGLEVCLDQNVARLKTYYEGDSTNGIAVAAVPGDPKVQVQLIPSCGAGINNPCTVANGPVFNVDVDKYDAKVNNSGTLGAITKLEGALMSPPLANVATYFETGKSAGTGHLAVYAPTAIPAPAKVT